MYREGESRGMLVGPLVIYNASAIRKKGWMCRGGSGPDERPAPIDPARNKAREMPVCPTLKSPMALELGSARFERAAGKEEQEQSREMWRWFLNP